MLAALIQNNQNVTPTPTPSTVVDSSSLYAGGDTWSDRDKSDDDFLQEIRRLGYRTRAEIPGREPGILPSTLVQVHATSLLVRVRATFLNVQVVERGNRIFFIATFQADPSEVHFIYTRPGETRPVADPGYGQKNSIISRRTYDDSDDIEYIASVDTTGFRGGFLEWHFFSAGIHQKSDFGTRDNGRAIQIPDRPPQLL